MAAIMSSRTGFMCTGYTILSKSLSTTIFYADILKKLKVKMVFILKFTRKGVKIILF